MLPSRVREGPRPTRPAPAAIRTQAKEDTGVAMHKVVIIGAGGVGNVVAHKCAQNSAVFGDILLASRTRSRCDAIAESVKELQGREIATAAVDADDVPQTVALLRDFKPDLLINVALPYQDLTLMDACLE